jgi:anti-sigma factor RsiW
MSIPDETLMAYADGELEPAQRAEVEAAMAADPKVAERVERHRALRRKLNAAFDPVLQETVPHALIAAARSSATSSSSAARPGAPGKGGHASGAEGGATVTDLRRVRAARAAEAKEAAAFARRGGELPRHTWTWFEWGAVAASIALGAVIAHLAMRAPATSRFGTENGHLVAQTDLAQALSTQLAIDQSMDTPVQIGVSFKSKAGDICRTFTVKDENVMGGLACRQGAEWRVQILANAPPGTNAQGGYKPAGGSMPTSVVAAVEQQIDGDPLDADGEAAARARGWK